jgi:hypothetical protein
MFRIRTMILLVALVAVGLWVYRDFAEDLRVLVWTDPHIERSIVSTPHGPHLLINYPHDPSRCPDRPKSRFLKPRSL